MTAREGRGHGASSTTWISPTGCPSAEAPPTQLSSSRRHQPRFRAIRERKNAVYAKTTEDIRRFTRHTTSMKTILRVLTLVLALGTTVLAADPPALRRPDAKKVLEAMEWREVTIVTIQQGIN